MESPLLETSVEGAHSILLSITGGRTCRCGRSTRPPRRVAEAAHPDANIIFGAMVDEKVQDEVWVTVVAPATARFPSVRRALRKDVTPADEADAEPRITRAPGASAST